jgi:hypothetical protein
MIVFPNPLNQRPLACLPLPAVLLRTMALALVLAFVLLLLRWGYSVETCLILVTGSGLMAIRISIGVSPVSLAMPSVA